jgi:hypothetical protein
MGFAEPKGVYAQIFSDLHQVKPFFKNLRLGTSFSNAEHGEYPEVHRRLLPCWERGS